jgi:sugar/nucleoside kinase (ribokinase family)
MIELSRLAYIDLYAIIKSASRRALHAASQQGIPLFINLGGDDLSEQDVTVLHGAHVAILQTSLDPDDQRKPFEYAKKLHDLVQPEITIITLAQKGLVYVTNGVVKQIPAYVVPVLHCCGAGAAFSAGFAYAYLHQWELIKALRFASALGGLYCTVKNGFGVFSLDHVLDFMMKQEPTLQKE